MRTEPLEGRDRRPDVRVGVVGIEVGEIRRAVPTATCDRKVFEWEVARRASLRTGHIAQLRPLIRYGIPLPEVTAGKVRGIVVPCTHVAHSVHRESHRTAASRRR